MSLSRGAMRESYGRPGCNRGRVLPKNRGMGETELFREIQRWWLNTFLRVFFPFEAVFLGCLFLVLGHNAPAKDQAVMAAMWVGLCVLLPAAFLAWGLVTVVTPTMLRARFIGLPGWRIPLDRVATAEVIRVSPLMDFGGYGWRGSRKHGRVLNVWGDHAVRITLTDGTMRTLGTQRADALAEAVLAGALGETGPVRRL